MDWDDNEWQGRSEEQVKRNYKIFGMAIVITTSFIIAGLLIIYLLSL